jgi:protein TonB
MEKVNILTADLLDIVFEYRNKVYGAYELRRTYPKRIAYAIGGTVLVCLLFIAGTIFANGKNKDRQTEVARDVVLAKFDEPVKPVEPPPPAKPEPLPAPTTQFTPPIIVNDVEPDEQMAEVDKLEETKIGTITTDGPGDVDVVDPPVEKISVTGNDLKVNRDIDNGFKTVQIEAQFTGGLEAWARFLRKHLNSEVPAQNGAPSSDYKVIVSFIVDRNGFISDVRAENDPGYGTAAEAVRVIKKSPNWTPAVQNGLNVIYRQKQTITFQVREE